MEVLLQEPWRARAHANPAQQDLRVWHPHERSRGGSGELRIRLMRGAAAPQIPCTSEGLQAVGARGVCGLPFSRARGRRKRIA